MRRKTTSGFTFVELIIVVAIVGILTAVLSVSITRYIQRQRMVEAQQNLVLVIDKMRSDARRLSTDEGFKWTGASGNYQLQNRDTPLVNIVIPNGVIITAVPAGTEYIYTAPNARTANVGGGQLVLAGQGGWTATINLVGVTGKVMRGAIKGT